MARGSRSCAPEKRAGFRKRERAGCAVRAAVGVDGWVEAAMTVAVFNGLVRTADASGIPLDDGVVSATAERGDSFAAPS